MRFLRAVAEYALLGKKRNEDIRQELEMISQLSTIINMGKTGVNILDNERKADSGACNELHTS
jgi:hypothetical protein